MNRYSGWQVLTSGDHIELCQVELPRNKFSSSSHNSVPLVRMTFTGNRNQIDSKSTRQSTQEVTRFSPRVLGKNLLARTHKAEGSISGK